MSRSILLLLAGISFAMTACTLPYSPAKDSVALTPEEIVGCYEINYLGRVFDRTGKQIRLSTQLGAIDFERGEYLVRQLSAPIKDPPESYYGPDSSFWKPVGPGRLLVIWTDGFYVTNMQLDVYSQELRGVAEESTDVAIHSLLLRRSKVIFRRIPCSNPEASH